MWPHIAHCPPEGWLSSGPCLWARKWPKDMGQRQSQAAFGPPSWAQICSQALCQRLCQKGSLVCLIPPAPFGRCSLPAGDCLCLLSVCLCLSLSLCVCVKWSLLLQQIRWDQARTGPQAAHLRSGATQSVKLKVKRDAQKAFRPTSAEFIHPPFCSRQLGVLSASRRLSLASERASTAPQIVVSSAPISLYLAPFRGFSSGEIDRAA